MKVGVNGAAETPDLGVQQRRRTDSMGTTETIPVSSILLNPKNFRHKAVASQEECFRELMKDKKDREYILNLATDIATRGLDPSSLPIVEPSGTQWRVLEGNRRLTALKAMANPDVIPDLPGVAEKALKAYRSKFSQLGAIASLPSELLVVVETDRDVADHWVTLKHTGVGQHKGAGTVEWDASGRARHEMSLAGAGTGRGASSEQSGRAIRLLDALREEFGGDTELLELVDRAADKGITTLGRLLIRPENRLRLGLDIGDDDVRFTVSRAALRATMLRVLSDLGTPKLNSRSVNKADDVLDYLDDIAADLPGSADRAPAPRPPSPGSGGSGSGSGSSGGGGGAPSPAPPAPKPSAKREKQPARRPYAGLKLSHASAKTRAVLKEMQELRFDSFPNTCVILNRVLIDCYMQDILEAVGEKVDQSPSKNVLTALRLVDTDAGVKAKDRKLPHLWNAVSTHTGELAVDSMHMYVHRVTFRATGDTGRVQCEHYQPFFEALEQYATDNPKK